MKTLWTLTFKHRWPCPMLLWAGFKVTWVNMDSLWTLMSTGAQKFKIPPWKIDLSHAYLSLETIVWLYQIITTYYNTLVNSQSNYSWPLFRHLFHRSQYFSFIHSACTHTLLTSEISHLINLYVMYMLLSTIAFIIKVLTL